MKKNILLVLLSAALLTGCEFDITLQRLFGGKKSEEETNQNEENSQEKPQDNENEGNNGQQTNPEEISENGYTATITTSGASFGSKFSAGSHFDTQQKQDQLKEYLSSQLQYAGLIDTISCTNLHSQTYEQPYLQFGSGSGVGAFALTSKVKIYKVQVKVLCYAKYNTTDNILMVDSWSHFLINDQDNDMTYNGNSAPSVMSFEKAFDAGVDSFTLASKDGRVFLKELTITWKK